MNTPGLIELSSINIRFSYLLCSASDVVVEGGEGCEKALTEATRTSYVEGRWVSDDELANTQYKILEAFLPADGDYSAYSVWCKFIRNVFLVVLYVLIEKLRSTTRYHDIDLALNNFCFKTISSGERLPGQ